LTSLAFAQRAGKMLAAVEIPAPVINERREIFMGLRCLRRPQKARVKNCEF
jgi:hypothetical protein